MSSPASLRDLYASPPNSWSFQAAPANASEVNAAAPSSASGSYQWSAHSNSSPLLGLSGSIEDDDASDAKTLLLGLLTAGLFQYAGSAFTMPWEVGKTLLQVQWIPRDVEELPAQGCNVAPKEQPEDEDEEVRVQPIFRGHYDNS